MADQVLVTLNAFDLDAPEEPRDLGATVTDDRGRFAVSYTTPKVETTDDDEIVSPLKSCSWEASMDRSQGSFICERKAHSQNGGVKND